MEYVHRTIPTEGEIKRLTSITSNTSIATIIDNWRQSSSQIEFHILCFSWGLEWIDLNIINTYIYSKIEFFFYFFFIKLLLILLLLLLLLLFIQFVSESGYCYWDSSTIHYLNCQRGKTISTFNFHEYKYDETASGLNKKYLTKS